MNRSIRWMERAGALALFLIMAVMAATTVTRYLFNHPIPDADAICRMLLAIVVFWGLAAACRHGEHIQLDLIVDRFPARLRALAIRAATTVTFLSVAVMTWMSADRIHDLWRSGEKTYDLGLPLWPFYGVAFLGLLASTLVLGLLVLGFIRADRKSDLESAIDGAS